MAKLASTAVVRLVTAVLAMAPPVLLHRAGWLTPGDLTTDQIRAWVHQPLTTGFLTALGQVGAWLLWTFLMYAVTDHVYRRLAARLRWQVHLRLPGPLQALAATLLGTTAVTTAALPATAHDHAATDTDPPPTTPPSAGGESPNRSHQTRTPPAFNTTLPEPDTATAPVSAALPPTHQQARTSVSATTHQAPDKTVHVAAGDNLWDLAAEHLGDAHRWRDIYTINRGQRQANGHALTDPNVIHVGWKLTVPAHHAAPAPHPAKPTPPEPTPSTPDPTTPATEPTTNTPEPSTPAPDNPVDTVTPEPDSETPHDQPDDEAGIALPAQGWISLGLAAAIASVATLLRLQRRRHAPLALTASTSTAPQPSPIPPCLTSIDAIGKRHHDINGNATTAVPAPIGINSDTDEMSLFQLPGTGLALHGEGAVPVARAILAAILTTNTAETTVLRPVVVTTAGLLARLLPEGAPTVGLDPDGTSFDGERLIVLTDTAAAITHAEEEMIGRRRLLDTLDAKTIADLNARGDHAETQPPYVLLIESTSRHTARLQAVAAHRAALDLHPVVLGPHDDIPAVEVTVDGTVVDSGPFPVARMSTLSASRLAAILTMLTETLARPEAGIDADHPPAEPSPAPTDAPEPVPAQPDTTALARLRVLGSVTVTTDTGPITTGMRSGSYNVLAMLAAHPAGRTLHQLAASLHPDTEPTAAIKRVRTDITSARRVLRAATGHEEAMFIVHDSATGRYQLDPDAVAVDLWQMLTAINQATGSDNDATALAALRQATDLYAGDFAEGHNHTWATDYATSYRHQILTAYARIAEILEPDHPDQAITALEHAADLDPINEELYQRIMRIHGRQQRPDAVRRTLRRLEERLADLGDAEPSQATRRVAERQLRPAGAVPGGRP